VLDLDQLHQTFVAMGEHAAEFFRAMSLGTPRTWAPHARQILMLRERYCTGDVDAALGHAVSFGAFDVHAVERILTARAPLRTLDEYVVSHMSNVLNGTRQITVELARKLAQIFSRPATLFLNL
jgi:hypothetical protein